MKTFRIEVKKVRYPDGKIGIKKEVINGLLKENFNEIKIEAADGHAYKIHINDFLIACKEEDGRLFVPARRWKEVEGRQKLLM